MHPVHSEAAKAKNLGTPMSRRAHIVSAISVKPDVQIFFERLSSCSRESGRAFTCSSSRAPIRSKRSCARSGSSQSAIAATKIVWPATGDSLLLSIQQFLGNVFRLASSKLRGRAGFRVIRHTDLMSQAIRVRTAAASVHNAQVPDAFPPWGTISGLLASSSLESRTIFQSVMELRRFLTHVLVFVAIQATLSLTVQSTRARVANITRPRIRETNLQQCQRKRDDCRNANIELQKGLSQDNTPLRIKHEFSSNSLTGQKRHTVSALTVKQL